MHYSWREIPKSNGEEPTQETPGGAENSTREEVFHDLAKAVRPWKREDDPPAEQR
jgi:hypothetical protein